MALLTSQQINRYFELYKGINITFTKDVISGLGLLPKQIFLKCLGDQWPCILYSSSMEGAKVILGMSPPLYEKIRNANNMVSLRYCFAGEEKKGPVAFFVAGKITGFTPYSAENKNLNFVNIEFSQRPPETLIATLGQLLEANINSKKRSEERIEITPDTMRRIGLKDKTTIIIIDGIPRKCILRDISFSGAKIIVPGVAKFLVGKKTDLKLDLEGASGHLSLKGDAVRFEEVSGRKDLAALAIHFDPASVPTDYKMRLNEYFGSLKKGLER